MTSEGQDPTTLKRPGAIPANQRKLSPEGVDFIWMVESKVNVSCGLHVPDNNSGVTIGAGYDMKERIGPQIVEDLTPFFGLWNAKLLSRGSGLRGKKASPPFHLASHSLDLAGNHSHHLWQQPPASFSLGLPLQRDSRRSLPQFHSALEFCFLNDFFCMSLGQQKTLISVVAAQKNSYSDIVKNRFHGVLLLQHEFDALVSMTYNAPGSTRHLPELVKTGIRENKWEPVHQMIHAQNTKQKDSVKGIGKRRAAEWELFSTGNYKPAIYKDEQEALSKWVCGVPGRHQHTRAYLHFPSKFEPARYHFERKH